MTTNMHLMVDIETLSSKTNACILSIGAVAFELEADKDDAASRVLKLVSNGLYTLVAPQTDRHIDPETVLWWFRQDDIARETLLIGEVMQLYHALRKLHDFAAECVAFWSHGMNFDLMILQDAYDQLKVKPPWHYKKMRDTRTLFSLLPTTTNKDIWPENPNKHHPLWDAACQAVAVQNAQSLLRNKSSAMA